MKVSIIIPLYNQKEFVSEAIESVLGQTFKDFEIIIVNEIGRASCRERV